MNNRKLLFTLAFLLLAPPILAQEPPPQGSVNGNASSQPQPPHQPQSKNIASRSTSDTLSASFEGIVVQVEPLEVKSVSGQVRQFLPGKKLSMVQPRRGDLVWLSYEPGPTVI
ncbi:hypothetical protein SAMN05216386_0886 [Nitrosospira briensis]|uniref:Uncharacterized protein n=1 Tax=Nitrosospira briensis TaxID=35799 RepID=A0A1I4YU07_9PROT|nr:hypothetical protein [Nitrosospira briensis]SFN41516.1 hypothetical protein SAMN05216386_0886 [Nitrosospira briensis]